MAATKQDMLNNGARDLYGDGRLHELITGGKGSAAVYIEVYTPTAYTTDKLARQAATEAAVEAEAVSAAAEKTI